ncbi:MAG TPA: hypothetical protein EYN66_21500 [Myxococcales bacterium]|nr:hypothetical protein [Myxococcales bacterium]
MCFRYIAGGINKYELAIRDATQTDPTENYTLADWPVAGGFAASEVPERLPSSPGYCSNTVAWENPDGTLRIMYPYATPQSMAAHGGTASHLTMDVWGSSDGGDTWALIAEDICNKYLGGDRNISSITGDVSGDWIRICCWVEDISPNGLITMVSADKGATWKVLDNALPDGDDEILVKTGSVEAGCRLTETCAVVGIGSPDGKFLRARSVAGAISANAVRWETATRDGTWSTIQRTKNFLFIGSASLDLMGIAGCRTDSHVMVLSVGSAQTAGGDKIQGFDGTRSFLIPFDSIENATQITGSSTSGWAYDGSWLSLGHKTEDDLGVAHWSGFQNMAMTAKTRVNINNSFKWTGDRAMMLSNLRERSAATPTTNGKAIATYCAGWHKRPLRSVVDVETDGATVNGYWVANGDTLKSNYWMTCWGKPGSSTPLSDDDCPDVPFWSLVRASGATDTWAPDKWTIDCTAAVNKYMFLRKLETYTGGDQGNVGALSWSMRVLDTGTPGLPVISTAHEPDIGASIRSTYTEAGGGTYHISMAATTNEVAIYDIGSGATIYHATGLDLTEWHEFRLGFGVAAYASRKGSAVYADFGYGRVGDYTWKNSGLLTVDTNTLTATNNNIELGCGLGGSASNSSKIEMREIVLVRGTTNAGLGQLGFANPRTLRGAPCVPGERHVAQGVVAAWGGGGGFLGDEFIAPIRYQYGVDQLNVASPASHWRSPAAGTVQIVFDSQLVDARQYFAHEGVGLAGCNAENVLVEWSADASFTSTAAVTVEFTQYTANALIYKPDGVKVSPGDTAKWEPHELVGAYCKWSNSAGTSHQVFKIAKNTRDTLYFSGMTQAIADYGIAAGDPLVIYGSQSMRTVGGTLYPRRYMRLTFAPLNTAEGYHQLGVVMAGAVVPFDVPMDWTNTDSESGNVNLTTNINGTRVAYVGGPARRVFKGSILGDAERFRDQFRAAVRTMGDYSGRPLALCMDDQDPAGSMLYSRFTEATTMENVAWKYDAANTRWIKVGNMAVVFEEEV